ncbi:MAG: hypothetical protein IIA44_06910 [Acidobacteria bacterium]|nr:hypothetical protein [Acidobacteriota bacterium]
MPHARVLSAFEGHPAGRILVASLGDDPVAGAEISVTVPGRAIWQIHAITAILVTSVDVADRRPLFRVTDGQRTIYEVASPAAHTASLSVRYSLTAGIAGDAQIASLAVVLPIPPLVLLPGWTIATSTVAIESADNWGAPVLYVTEIPERGEGVWDELARAVAEEIIERRAISV